MRAAAQRLLRDPRLGFLAVTALFLLSLRGLARIKERLGAEGGVLDILVYGVVLVYLVGAAVFAAYLRGRG